MSGGMWKAGQWPDDICSGDIRYGKSSNYDGFYLADASHGIPTFGNVADSSPATIRGQHVQVFNYPGQTEAIAAQLVHRWNCHTDLLDALKAVRSTLVRLAWEENSILIEGIDAALAKTGSQP